MKKARTIEDIYHIFDPSNPITESERELYVNVYKEDLSNLKKKLKFSAKNGETFYIAGQSGNGKTTAIKHLVSQSDIKNKYNVITLAGKEFFQEDNVDIIDLLLMIGIAVVENDKELSDKYYNYIEDLYNKNIGILKSETITNKENKKGLELENKLRFKFNFLTLFSNQSSFKANYKLNKEVREETREVFNINKEELIEKINDIILDYRVLKNNDKLLIVIDDLEKKDLKDIQILFETGISNYFNKIKAVKIISMPIVFKRYHPFNSEQSDNIFEFGIKLKEFQGKDYIKKNIKLLSQVITQRLDNKSLIEENVIKDIVEISGGNLREIIKIVNSAAFHSLDETETITSFEFKKAILKIQRLYSPSVSRMLNFLDYIRVYKTVGDTEENNDKLIKAFQSNLIFAYFDGHTWYDINPIIDESIDFYKGMM